MALIEDKHTKNDQLIGNIGEADRFFMTKDRKRDVIRDFEDGVDRIDLSHFGVEFDDLKIVDKANGTGVRIVVGGEKIFLPGLSAVDFDESDFVFAAPSAGAPAVTFNQISDNTRKNNKLVGTDAADEFIFVRDNKRDVIREFTDGEDVINLSRFNVNFEDLRIVNIAKNDDVRIIVEGETIVVRDVDASDFSEADFIF